ncbi:MAG TPA: PAS domain S-box protein [Rubrivivax sp.]|nr:PAS domain S-box protein [Rubrivivax sp.]
MAHLYSPTAPPALLPPRTALASLLDGVAEPLLLFDDLGRTSFCNREAMRLLGAEPGLSVVQLETVLGAAAVAWLSERLAERAAGEAQLRCTLPGARGARLSCWRIGRDLALRVQPEPAVPAAAALPALEPGPALEMLRMLWAMPFPATLQDSRFRLLAVNDAYLHFSGRTREALIGTDPVLQQPLEDQAAHIESRRELPAWLAGQPVPRLSEQRLIDASGRERWSRVSAYPLAAADGQPLLLCVLQDSTAEHVARAQADRSLDELAQWFDLSPTGMLVFDEAGLIVRSNPAFEALVGQVPVLLADASAELQALLAWQQGAPRPELRPGAAPLETHQLVPLPDGRRQRLSARVRGFATEQGQQRFMAVVEDRSAEEERDLAQLEIGALMDTAGVGVATFDSARGWLRPREQRRRAPAKSAGLQSIARDIVEPASLPEYERLQQALRLGQRTEVRYAVHHAELGRRWLLTRVEPGEADAGRRTVVTVDVTEQESAQRHGEQLLRELTTILDGTTAGIAYLRGALLVRCNRRFEALLGLPAGAAAGATVAELFGRFPQALAALQAGQSFETELALPQDDGSVAWASLSVRRAEAAPAEHEAVAVLSDISRLKSQQSELEALLRERELMFSLSDVGIVYLRGGRIERANQAMAALTGYADSELTALDPAELAPDRETHLRHQQDELRMLRQQGRYHGERSLRRRDGSLIRVQVAQRLVDEADEMAGRICSFVDVDERHRAREELLRQAGRTRAMLDSVLVGIVTVGDGGIEWMNRSARRMFAGDLADFVGEPIATVATPEADHPLRRTDWLHALAEGHAHSFECRLKARDGREFWVVGNVVPTGGDDGRQLTFALLDIERRRQAEISIAQAQASLQRIIETAPLAIALFDAETRRVLQANQAAAAFFGRAAGQLTGGTLHDWFGAAAADTLEQDLRAAAASHETLKRELRLDSPAEAGGARLWDTRVVSLPSGAGTREQVLLVASDVTEQRAEAQARFDAALAQREMLVKEVHHRIKNNLQGVAGLLQQNAARHPQVASILSESVSQVQAIAQVYGLQVGAGGLLRVAGVLEAIALSVQRTFGRTVQVQVDGGAPRRMLLPEAEAIPIALTINELLTNAVKHSPQGDVRCRLSCEGGELRVAIRNLGRLRAGFDLAQFPGGVSGLGLVRALLPRRSAAFTLTQQGGEVLTEIVLRPPSVMPGAP